MTQIVCFTFNPFYENTYIIYDETGACVVIDPGCYSKREQTELVAFIEKNNLKPVYLLNTHCHIDHVLGNKYVADTYKIPFLMPEGEQIVLDEVVNYAPSMGMNYQKSPNAERFLVEGEDLEFGNTILKIISAPGHSPDHVCFYCEKEKFIASGDVLFFDSIGRTDLPGGDYNILINSIKNKLMVLPDDVKVYAGHMQSTTIGRERKLNPFLNA